jgi:hypothetical protein
LAVLVFAFAGATSVLAQVDYSTATLKGTVLDPQGLVVTSARVTISSPDTGWSRIIQTGVDGTYRFASLMPGTYRLQVEAPGFATALVMVVVSVGESANHDVRLQLGAARDAVDVPEMVPLVQMERTQQANTIDRRQLADLPNLTRLFTDTVFTLPGVSSSEAPRAQAPGFCGFQSTGLSIGGSNGRSNLVTIDGGENDLGSGQLRTPNVPVESVQEFQVNRSSFAAEFGFTAGTAVNVVTRSGTNRWRGAAHAYFGNEHISATNYFAPRTDKKAFQQDFVTGFTLGGPLVRNKLFMFTAYEFTKSDKPQFRNYANTDAAKGIRANVAQQEYVSQLAASGDPLLQATAGQLQFLLDPANFPNTMLMLGSNTGAFNDWKKFNNGVTRLDHQPTADDSITARFSWQHDDSSRMFMLDPSNAPDDAILGFWRDYTLLGAWSHSFTPKVLNQLRVQVVPMSSLESPPVSPHTAYVKIVGLGQFGGEVGEPFILHQRRFQFEDSLSAIWGKHTLKFGASYRPFTYVIRNELYFGGSFYFVGSAIPIVGGVIQPSSPAFLPLVGFNLAHGLPATGVSATNLTALQTFNLGLPLLYMQGFGNPETTGWEHYFGSYVQDSWKITRNLTLDLGGRVDVDAPSQPMPRNIYFSPRVGFAWNPGGDQKTVIRGGSGIFVAPIPLFIGYVSNLLSEKGDHINWVAGTLSAADTRILTLWAMLSGCTPQEPERCAQQPPFPRLSASQVEAAGFQIGPGQPGRVIYDIMQPYKNPYSVQASLSVQRELGSNMAIEVGYQMYHGVHLSVPLDTNMRETGIVDPFIGPIYTPIDPTLMERLTSESIGSSIYHGLLASLNRRFARGLQFQVNYTFSKAMDDNTDFNGDFRPFRPTRVGREWGLSTFDIRHNFVANAVYEAPFKAGGNFVSHVLADSTFSPILFLRSGIPFTVRVPGLQNGAGSTPLWARPWIAARNTGIGPNFYSLDLRITKSFYFDRDLGRRLDFLVQGTNILNRTNFSALNDTFPGGCMLPQAIPQPLPTGGVCDPQPFNVGPYSINYLTGPFNVRGVKGLDSSTPLGFKAAFDPRQVQFGLRLVF